MSQFIQAKPYPYELPTHRKIALLIIDMQRDFLESGGFGESLGNDVSRLRTIIPIVQQLLAVFREKTLPIFYTREGHKPDLSDCPSAKLKRGKSSLKIGDYGSMGRILVLGEKGNDIVDELKPLANEIIIDKPGKGAFYATSLQNHLQKKQITHLILAGVTTEVCVQTTMREANDRGYESLLVEDGTESYFPFFKQATLEMVHAQGGIVGWTAHSNDIIQAFEKWNIE